MRIFFPALSAAILSSTALADVNYVDFNSTSGLNFMGNAYATGGRVRLTDDSLSQAGAIWFATPQLITSPFEMECVFRWVGGSPGADGFAFVIQNTSAFQIGGPGCELAYDGILNGVAIEIDNWSNTSCNGPLVSDPGSTHVSVHTSGASGLSVSESTSLGSTTVIPNVEDGADHTLRVEYTPGTLDVFIDNLVTPVLSVPLDLDGTLFLTDGTAFVGFTAGTGGASQRHEVASWSFTENTGTPTGNNSPAIPVINEPSSPGQTLNPFDVHMEIGAFTDADVGDSHACTDWEIWSTSPVERVWFSSCATGPESVHAHLGDGVFMGAQSGETSLAGSTSYELRVRVSDDSGDPVTQWSQRATIPFTTGAKSSTFPLEVDDVLSSPEPRWTTTARADVILAGGGSPPSIRLENANSELLFTISGFDGVTNLFIDEPELHDHEAVRVVLEGGATGLVLAESTLTFVDYECETHRVLLPAINLSAGQSLYLWVSQDGSTYSGNAGQTAPDFTTLARGQDFPWVTAPGYEIDVFATDFQLPVNIAFIPNAGTGPNDPFFYVTELYGKIRVVDRSGNVSDYATNLIDFMQTGAFPGSGEQGLTGITVDPATGDVYAALLYDSQMFPGIHYPRVDRFTSNDGGLTAATQTTILDMVGESQGQSHQISHLEIHPDGKLRVSMGDGFAASTAQNIHSFRGKILRVNLDGTAPTDNPFYDAGDGITGRDYTWVLGIRNAFGGRYRHTDSSYYIVENGPSIDRIARLSTGLNMGWTGSDASMFTNALHNWIPAVGPVNIAFTEPQVFNGSGFPPSAQGRAFITESGPTYASGPQVQGKRISQWTFDMSGDPVLDPEHPFLVNYVGSGRATAVALAAGPDGLYFSELYSDTDNSPTLPGARILRVRFVGGVDCNGNDTPDVCDIASGTSADVNGDGIPDECGMGASLCTGDGGDQAGCTDCPCGNNASPGTIGGCLNSAGTATRLFATGSPSVSLPSGSSDDLRFALGEAPASAFCVLSSGDSVAPTNAMNPCFGADSGVQSALFDGLRCSVVNTRRHGGRSADSNGEVGTTNNPWGGEAAPPAGIAANAGFAAGQTRYYQVTHRDDPLLVCNRGLNTSQAIQVIHTP